MCGFGGEIADGAAGPDVAALERMSAALAPRGPDGHGQWIDGRIGLVHRRLKVIDLTEAGAQPMVDAERGLAIVFNGCIYNYRELRSELEAAGERFRSTSDTEVILAAYRCFGRERFVDRLIGMFAFAIVETTPGGRVVLGRDRLGVKPLYLAEAPGGRLRFASTLPALLAAGGVDRAIDPTALHHYLSFHSVVPAPRTILRGVRKLPPATLLTIAPDGGRSERRYWSGPALELVGDALTAPAERERGLFSPAYVERLPAAPNDRVTTLEGNRLWQLALLELWLQAHRAG